MNAEWREKPPRVRSLTRDIAPAAIYWQRVFETYSNGQLREAMDALRLETQAGVSAKKRMPRVFGLAGEACRRKLGLTPYPVQYMAGASLATCEIAQMNTGEGKTLASIFPACFMALDEKGVHVITVNEYLARRDFELNTPVYNLLGFTTGLSLSGMDISEKQSAYRADITYSTATEAGFDYLRDGIAAHATDRVQRGQYFAIVDEADSILLDEAVTPMILSGGGTSDNSNYVVADTFVKYLKKEVYASLEDDERDIDDFDCDYVVDQKLRCAYLTSEGIRKAEMYYRVKNLFDIENIAYYHYILQAMDAHGTLERDVDYIVRDGKAQIVDRNTGRVMDGRRYAAGLHQAVEAKEGLEIHSESLTLSTITYQKFFLNYRNLAGMSGTAWQGRRELSDTYRLPVRRIPPNRPCIRIDRPDRFLGGGESALNALCDMALNAHLAGRPVLIGTPDDKTSETVSALLHEKGVAHAVLSAKQNADEAATIARAGLEGSVLVATNMAGRGTDIRLGCDDASAERIRALGGLLVLGARRQRSGRVDWQLAGRAGRQGDPGESQFFVSPDDDLMRLYGDGKLNRRAVRRAQRMAEAVDASQRSAALEADDVLQAHRKNVLSERDRLLESDRPGDIVRDMTRREILSLIERYPSEENNFADFRVAFCRIFGKEALASEASPPYADVYYRSAMDVLETKESEVPGIFDELARAVTLQCIDEQWSRFLEAFEELRQGYRLMANGRGKPRDVLIMTSAKMLEETGQMILDESLKRVFRCRLTKAERRA